MKTKNCENCNLDFNYEPPVNYPDKRKYCDACSAKKKAEWDAKDKPQIANEGVAQAIAVAANRGPNANRNTTMYTSYAKDIYLGIHDKLTLFEMKDGVSDAKIMAKAIELVQQAEKAFS